MKISSYVTTLPVGAWPMYSPSLVPVTTFLATTLSSCAISSSFVTTRSGKARNSVAQTCLSASAAGASSSNGVLIRASGATTSSITFAMRSRSRVFAASWNGGTSPGWRLLRQWASSPPSRLLLLDATKQDPER